MLDITNVDQVSQVFTSIQESSPHPVKCLISAAGIQQDCLAIDYKATDFERIMRVNVVGSFNVSQAAAKLMIDHGKGGSIVLIASMSGHIANRDLHCSAYNTSKSAVIQMCRSLAVEWAEHGIRVNTLSPGQC